MSAERINEHLQLGISLREREGWVFTSAIGLCWLCATFNKTLVHVIVKECTCLDCKAQAVPATFSSFLFALQGIHSKVRSDLEGDCKFFHLPRCLYLLGLYLNVFWWKQS